VRRRGLDRLSFATAPALYAAVWLCGGIVLAGYQWIAPATLIAAILSFALLSLMATRKALRVALLPLAGAWLTLGLLVSEIEPGPDPQTQLGVIADAGEATAVHGEVTRTTPSASLNRHRPSAPLCGKNRARVSMCGWLPRMAARCPVDCAQPPTHLRINHSLPSTAEIRSRLRSRCTCPSAILTPECGMLPRGCGSRA